MNKIRINYLFLLSVISVSILFFFGPFTYEIYSIDGLIYYYFCCLLFFLGLSNNKLVFKKRKKRKVNYYLNKKSVCVLWIINFVIIICFLIFITNIIRTVGSNYSFASEDYRYLLDGRNNLEKLVESLLHLASPVFLIYEKSLNKINFKKLGISCNIVYWLPPLAYLMTGGRWSAFVYILIYFFIKKDNHTRKRKKISFKKVIMVVFIFFILTIVYSLFTERGYLSIYENYLFYPGDVKLKDWAIELANLTNGATVTIYKISHYFSESLCAFSYLFKNYGGQAHLFGLFSFSIITYLMMPFGYNSAGFKNIVLSYPGAGKYMSFVHGYIVDFGIVLAPLGIFLTGLLFAYIRNNRNYNNICKLIYYYTIVMCIVAPIYNIWGVGSINLDIFFIIILYIFIKKMTFINIEVEGD